MAEDVQQSITTPQLPGSENGEGVFTDTPPPPQLAIPSFPSTADQVTRNDLILLQQAVIKGWNITPESKAKAIATAEWIRDHGRDARVRLRALEFLLSVDKHQLDIVKAFSPQQPTTAVQVNVSTGSSDLSRLSDAELEARVRELRAGSGG
jgi:hypothetical protein